MMMNSMEEAASPVVLDPARLTEEAPKLVRSASRAMEGLATEIQSCDGGRRPRRYAWKVGGPELGLLEAYMLEIWGISAGAEPQCARDKELALQARDTLYFIQLLQDMIDYGRLQSTFSNQPKELLPAFNWCLPLFASSKPRRKIMRGIKVVNQETLKIGHLLENGGGPSPNPPRPPVPDAGSEKGGGPSPNPPGAEPQCARDKENLLSSAPSHATLPDRFIFPPDQRPPASTCSVSLPVIDLSRGRDELRSAVLEAGKEHEFFQLLDFPGHRTGYARPAGFSSSTAQGFSRYLFFVCWLWLLMTHLHPTNWPGDLQAGGTGSTITFPSSPFNGIMSAAEASSGFTVGGGHALGAELNHMLASPRSTAARARGHGHGGSQPVFIDASGGNFLVININTPQQGDQGVAAPAQDGQGDHAQRALQSVFGGLVPVCFTLLLLNGASPGYIKAASCVGLGLVTGFTYLGLASKKRAMAAARVVASMAMAAVSIALVYTVSENVYIKSTCGIIGAAATVATMAINWRNNSFL